MPLSITSVTQSTHSGVPCDHIAVVVNHEGVNRTFNTNFGEIDSYFDNLTLIQQLEMLIYLWAKYRRREGRAVIGVNIA